MTTVLRETVISKEDPQYRIIEGIWFDYSLSELIKHVPTIDMYDRIHLFELVLEEVSRRPGLSYTPNDFLVGGFNTGTDIRSH